MKITVKLFGMLSTRFPDYHPGRGVVMEIPEGSDVNDLLTLLEISDTRGATVILENRVLSKQEKLPHGALVHVLQILSGG